jgi:hypothetical protein
MDPMIYKMSELLYCLLVRGGAIVSYLHIVLQGIFVGIHRGSLGLVFVKEHILRMDILYSSHIGGRVLYFVMDHPVQFL